MQLKTKISISKTLVYAISVSAILCAGAQAQNFRDLLNNAVKQGINKAKSTVRDGINQYGSVGGAQGNSGSEGSSAQQNPYPSAGSNPYPSSGSNPYPSSGSNPYPSSGSNPYPSSGSNPYPSSGSNPYPSSGSNPYPSSGSNPYPSSGSHHSSTQSRPTSGGGMGGVGPGGIFGSQGYRYGQHHGGKTDGEIDPMAIKKAREAEQTANSVPPPPPLVLNKAPGTDETSVFGIAAIESAARKKTLHVNFAARFGFKPDGGKPGTPWWVVDGYDREPSIYDP